MNMVYSGYILHMEWRYYRGRLTLCSQWDPCAECQGVQSGPLPHCCRGRLQSCGGGGVSVSVMSHAIRAITQCHTPSQLSLFSHAITLLVPCVTHTHTHGTMYIFVHSSHHVTHHKYSIGVGRREYPVTHTLNTKRPHIWSCMVMKTWTATMQTPNPFQLSPLTRLWTPKTSVSTSYPTRWQHARTWDKCTNCRFPSTLYLN